MAKEWYVLRVQAGRAKSRDAIDVREVSRKDSAPVRLKPDALDKTVRARSRVKRRLTCAMPEQRTREGRTRRVGHGVIGRVGHVNLDEQ